MNVLSSPLSLDLATALDIKLAAEQEAKFQALRTLHSSKIRMLSTSLEAKEKEIVKLKVLGKDNRRTQMIEAYKVKVKELELTVDVLKAELCRKSDMTAEEVIDFVIRKTISGPKRFRPQSREELEKTISELEKKLKRVSNQLAAAGASGNGATDNRSVAASVTGSVRPGGRPSSASRGRSSRDASGPAALPTASITEGRTFSSSAPSRPEDMNQIYSLGREVASLKTKADTYHATIEHQREEISRLRMRNAELCVIEEESDFQDRQFKDLKRAHDVQAEDLDEVTRQLSKALNDNVQLRSRMNIEAEQMELDRDVLSDQCEKILRQNSALLGRLSEIEAELDKKILPADGPSGRRQSLSQPLPSESAEPSSKMDQKLARLTDKLKASEAQIAALQTEVHSVKDLKDSLREKNILIRDLQTKLSLKPSGSSGMIHFEHGGEAAGGSDLSLREENERLKKALHIAASEVASAGGKKTVAGAGIAVAKDAKEDGDSRVAALVAPSEVFHLLNELMSSLGVAVEMLTGSGSRLIGGQRLAAAVERLQKMGYGQGGAVNSGVLFDWASFERLSKSLASV